MDKFDMEGSMSKEFIREEMEGREYNMKWGIGIDDNRGCFLLGANINIGDGHCYLCVYLGFKTLVIGKDYF